MELPVAKKEFLKGVSHSVRASQAILQYGVGAMVDFPEQTLMTAAPEYWREQVVRIHDERLEKALKVNFFGLPAGKDDVNGVGTEGISYVRFPEWYFCPKCRRFQPLKDWVNAYRATQSKKAENDPNMIKVLQCPYCGRGQELVVARIITACECGHIDDFPWIQWVHCKNVNGGARRICNHPILTFKTGASSSEGLESLTVTCESCHAKATLKGAFEKDVFQKLDEKYPGQYNFKCTGKHPWKHTKELCSRYPKVMQRGSSAVYFPITESSLVIPPYSSQITKKVEDSKGYGECKGIIAGYRNSTVIPVELLQKLIEDQVQRSAKDISLEKSIDFDKVYAVLERRWMSPEDAEEYTTTSVKYRAEEYEALNGEVSFPTGDGGDFVREETTISDYRIPCLKGISLIHKVREVQALVGFSRLNPAEPVTSKEATERIVSVKQPETDWYPAYEVRGEGIFIEFESSAIMEWEKKHPEIQERVDILNDNYQNSFMGSIRPRTISAKFLLLHTISHALIKQLSFECGYSIAALKERLYCSEIEDGKQMSGIFIYTASGDSEGTLGGLVRQGRSDTFPAVFKKAMESAMTCSNDPVCSLSKGQGRDSLNLSACYACSLIPETSCEEFNVFLDRGMIVGTYKDHSIGFYSEQLYTNTGWKKITVGQ